MTERTAEDRLEWMEFVGRDPCPQLANEWYLIQFHRVADELFNEIFNHVARESFGIVL